MSNEIDICRLNALNILSRMTHMQIGLNYYYNDYFMHAQARLANIMIIKGFLYFIFSFFAFDFF